MIYRDAGYTPWYLASFGGWGSAWSTFPLNPQWPEGTWYGSPSQGELVLPGPVKRIIQVKVDGATLVPGQDYVLYNHRRLVRQANNPGPLSASASWPILQRLDLPDTEAGTWSVTYSWGKPVPSSGVLAALELGIEIAKAVSNPIDPTIRLPQRVTSVSSQGVSAVVQDPINFIERGITGIPVVDLFRTSANPGGLRRRTRVYTARLDRSRTRSRRRRRSRRDRARPSVSIDIVVAPDTLDDVAELILGAAGAALDSVPFPQLASPPTPRFLAAGDVAWSGTGGLAVSFVKLALGQPGKELFAEPNIGDALWAMVWAQFSVQICQTVPVVETSSIAGARFPTAAVATEAAARVLAPGWTVFSWLSSLADQSALLGAPGTSAGLRQVLVGPMMPKGPQGGLLVLDIAVWCNLVG